VDALYAVRGLAGVASASGQRKGGLASSNLRLCWRGRWRWPAAGRRRLHERRDDARDRVRAAGRAAAPSRLRCVKRERGAGRPQHQRHRRAHALARVAR